jgi:hypothetical protein
VQLDLQRRRELGIHRSDRPGHRRFDDSPGLIRRDRERARQARAGIERLSRRKVPGHPGPLQQLLGRRQELDELEGLLRVGAVGIDGQPGPAQRRRRRPALRRRQRPDRHVARHARRSRVLNQRMRVGPVPHESRLPILELKPHRLLLPGQRRPRNQPVPHGIAHEGQRPDGGGRVHAYRAVIIQDGAPEGREVLDEHGHQALVARPLPDEPMADAPGADQGEAAIAQLGQRGGWRCEEIRPPVQHPHVGEQR